MQVFTGKDEITICIIRQDGVQRGQIGHIIATIEKRGFKIAAMKTMMLKPEMQHMSKLFGPIDKKEAVPVVAMIVQGAAVTRTLLKVLGI